MAKVQLRDRVAARGVLRDSHEERFADNLAVSAASLLKPDGPVRTVEAFLRSRRGRRAPARVLCR